MIKTSSKIDKILETFEEKFVVDLDSIAGVTHLCNGKHRVISIIKNAPDVIKDFLRQALENQKQQVELDLIEKILKMLRTKEKDWELYDVDKYLVNLSHEI